MALFFCLAIAAILPIPAKAQSAATQNAAAPFTLISTASLNRELPLWIRFDAEERIRLEGFSGFGFRPDFSDGYLLNRLRIGMALRPASWVQFRFQAQDARLAAKNLRPYAPPYQDTFDLRLAYAELGAGERIHTAVRIGRQEINLGEERLVGSAGWANAARSFDAVRLTVQYRKYTVDAFAASPVVLHDGEFGRRIAGNNLHGLAGSLENVIPSSKIEPYLLWRLSPRAAMEAGGFGHLGFTVAGLRWVGTFAQHFDYGVEVAREQGSLGTDRIAAWAGHWLAGYRFLAPGSPRFFAEFNHATGDANPRDARRQTFDQLFPSGHEKYGTTDQIGWANTLHARSGIELRPAPRWTAAVKLGAYWLADPHDALYNTSGTVVVPRGDGSAGRAVGSEIAALAVYSFSRQLQVVAGIGHLFPGAFLKRTTPGKGYTYPYLGLTVGL